MNAVHEFFCNSDLLCHMFCLMELDDVTRCMVLRSRCGALSIRTICWKLRMAFDKSARKAISPLSYKLYASDKRTLIEPRVQGYSCDAMRSVVDLTIDPSDKKYTAFLSRCVPFIFRGVQRLVLSGERSILGIMEDVRLMRVMRALPLGIDVQINNFDRQGSVDMGAKGRVYVPRPHNEQDQECESFIRGFLSGTRNVVLSAGEGFKTSHVTGFCRMISWMKCLTLKMECGAGMVNNSRLSAGSFRDVGLLATMHDGYMPFSMNDDDAHINSCARLETLVLDVREGFSAPLVRSMCFEDSRRCLTIQSVIHGWTPAHLTQSLAVRRPMVMRSVVRVDLIGMVDRIVLGGCIFMPNVKEVRFVVPLDSAIDLYDGPASLNLTSLGHMNFGLSLSHGEQIAEIVKGSFPGATSVHVGIEWVGTNTPNTWWAGSRGGRAYLSWLVRELQQRGERCAVVVDASTFAMMSLYDLPDVSLQSVSGDWNHYYNIGNGDASTVLLASGRACCSLSNVTLTSPGANERLTSLCEACTADISALL